MNVQTMSTVFAVLSIIALAIAGAGLAALTPVGRSLRPVLGRAGLPVGFLVAAVATGGSLYYSEIANFEPCTLCWYQRIAMYPMVVLLGVAIVRYDRAVRWYTLPLAVVGGSISVYHYVLQRFPSLSGEACSLDNPCTLTWVWEFGFVSIPLMALAGFLAIIVATWWAGSHDRQPS